MCFQFYQLEKGKLEKNIKLCVRASVVKKTLKSAGGVHVMVVLKLSFIYNTTVYNTKCYILITLLFHIWRDPRRLLKLYKL